MAGDRLLAATRTARRTLRTLEIANSEKSEERLLIGLRAGDARAFVDPARGGRLSRLEVAGLSLLLPESDDPMGWGSFPMAPWAGRVRRGRFRFEGREYELPRNLPPHAIHGTTFTRAWSDERDGRISISLGPAWPWPGRAIQEFVLSATALEMTLEIHADKRPFPASAGWHPWFPRRLARGEEAAVRLDAGAMYRRDGEEIPTGELVSPPPGPWDDCFTQLSRAPAVRWPGAVEVVFRTSLDHFEVYAEPEHALCVEPLTGPPDALNLEPHIVSPGDPLRASVSLEWTLE
jgi:aldose 1-epimerase